MTTLPAYPLGLSAIAERFGISTPELLEEIANGELVVISWGDQSSRRVSVNVIH